MTMTMASFKGEAYLAEWRRLKPRQQKLCKDLARNDGSTVAAALKRLFPGKWKRILKSSNSYCLLGPAEASDGREKPFPRVTGMCRRARRHDWGRWWWVSAGMSEKSYQQRSCAWCLKIQKRRSVKK